MQIFKLPSKIQNFGIEVEAQSFTEAQSLSMLSPKYESHYQYINKILKLHLVRAILEVSIFLQASTASNIRFLDMFLCSFLRYFSSPFAKKHILSINTFLNQGDDLSYGCII